MRSYKYVDNVLYGNGTYIYGFVYYQILILCMYNKQISVLYDFYYIYMYSIISTIMFVNFIYSCIVFICISYTCSLCYVYLSC